MLDHIQYWPHPVFMHIASCSSADISEASVKWSMFSHFSG